MLSLSKNIILFLFSSTISENRRAEQVLLRGLLVPVPGGIGRDKQVGELIGYKNCVHMYVNAKMIPFETIPGMGDKGEWWRG
jgi:hypothetical protein